jgi:hypothetical protein
LKVVFLCGSLEPGKDGVGDYSMRLATEMIKLNFTVALIALNDQHINGKVFETKQFENNLEIPQLRLPSEWSTGKRFEYAKDWISRFNPDWISLQFVIFSFHPKGLPFGLSKQLLLLARGKRWHIMFHELWLGMDINATRKNRLWGWLQKNIIKKVLVDIKPALIHTQSRFYQVQLTKMSFDAGYLPLFGNIPNQYPDNSDKSLSHINSSNKIRLVHFATVHAGAPIDEFAKEVARYSNEMDIQISLTFIGRSGPEQNKWIESFESQNLFAESLGELAPASISELLSSSTMGISSTPIILAEKSGSIAAMLEHGLPVLCIAYPWLAPKGLNIETLPGVFQYTNGIFKQIIESKKKYNDGFSVESVSSKLASCFNTQMNQTRFIS